VYSGDHAHLNFVAGPEEADVILLWIKPVMRPLFPADQNPLQVNLSNCVVDVDHINALIAKKPTILDINHANPIVIDEIYNEGTMNRFPAVPATFGVEPEALLDVVSGQFNPSGKMPFTTPIDNRTVENNKEDVPGYDEGEGYALFRFGEGIPYED
jgi:beta-glucosidase